VEWKQLVKELVYILLRRLGNFLSGMETHSPGVPAPAFSVLGNFLSGMETLVADAAPAAASNLGNFLSGMETIIHAGDVPEPDTLETSLVEWKQQDVKVRVSPSIPLETSLVEWKLGSGHGLAAVRSGLGNFLSGMETRVVDGDTIVVDFPWKLP